MRPNKSAALRPSAIVVINGISCIGQMMIHNGGDAARLFVFSDCPSFASTDTKVAHRYRFGGYAGAKHLKNDRPTSLPRHFSVVARDSLARTQLDAGAVRRPLVSLRFPHHLHSTSRFRDV